MDYFITNIAISLLMLATAGIIKNAPAKIHLALLWVALVCWFIPWHTVDFLFLHTVVPDVFILESLDWPNQITTLTDNASIALLGASPVVENVNKISMFDEIQAYATNSINLTWLFLTLCLVGCLFLVADLVKYFSYLSTLHASAKTSNYLLAKHALSNRLSFNRTVEVKITASNEPGMATGLFSPIIWVDENFVNSKQISSILLHELTHIRNYDPVYKWLTVLSKRIFWWNPLVILLVKRLEELIELNCDERCYQLKKDDYSIDLGEIILLQNKRKMSAHLESTSFNYIATIYTRENVNIKRLKSLNKEKTMKLKYISIACSSVLLSAVVSAQMNVDQSNLKQVKTVNFSSNEKELNKVDNVQQMYERALRAKQRSADRTLKSIYLKDTPENAQYNAQVKQLVALSTDAISNDVDVMTTIFNNILNWSNNRIKLSDDLEKRLTMQTLSIQHFLLQQQGKTEAIISLIMDEYKTIDNVPQFYRNHLKRAYLLLNNPEKAISVMSLFDLSDENIAIGVVTGTATAYMANQQAEKGLAIIESRLLLGKDSETKHLLSTKYQLLVEMGSDESEVVASRLKQEFNRPRPPKYRNGNTRSMSWSPILDHI